MNLVLSTLTISAYIYLTFHCARRVLINERKERLSGLGALRNRIKELESEKESNCAEKIKLQGEADNIFTLYEITKEIAAVLHKDEAFKLFEKKLSEHVQFTECKVLKSDDEGLSELISSRDYFVIELKTKDKTVGHLLLKGVSEDEKEKTRILATQFMLALRRVELYQEIERIAITDSLTEVHTRRYCLERLAEEVGRSKQQGLDMALLMLDVDHFKDINDNFGHLTGDQVLREIARLIKENLREIDIAGRFGGEEFCIILPDTDTEGALYAGERIRQAVEAASIRAYDNTINARVSIGICQFPQDGHKANDLIDKADQALYNAKRDGRNRICVFGKT